MKSLLSSVVPQTVCIFVVFSSVISSWCDGVEVDATGVTGGRFRAVQRIALNHTREFFLIFYSLQGFRLP